MNQFSRIFYLLSFDFTDLAWYIIFRTVPCDFGACPVSSNFLQCTPSSRACVEKKNVLKKKSGKNGQVKFFLAQGLISSYPHMPAHSSLEAKMMAHAMKALDPNVTGQKIADGVNQKFGTSHNRDWASSKKRCFGRLRSCSYSRERIQWSFLKVSLKKAFECECIWICIHLQGWERGVSSCVGVWGDFFLGLVKLNRRSILNLGAPGLNTKILGVL